MLKRLQNTYIKLTSECSRLFEDTDLKESVQSVVNDGHEHVTTWNHLTRQSVWGMNQQKDIIMSSHNRLNSSAVLNAISKMMDSVRSAKDSESSYMCQIRECLDKCRDIASTKQETIEGYLRNIADLTLKIRTLEETIRTLLREAAEFDVIADRLADRARELDDRWWFKKIFMAVIGVLLVTLTAGLILTVAAVAFLGNFDLNTASGCREGARESRQKAREKRNEIASLQSNIQARQSEVAKLQQMKDRVTADKDTIHGIERELNNLMQGIQSLNIERSSDHVLGLLQSCADRLTLFEEADSEYRLQNFKEEWTTMERQLTQFSMPFSDFIF